ncbi:MAG: hypothetical protein ACFFCZ_21525 [Promethearchaeota archaeon]
MNLIENVFLWLGVLLGLIILGEALALFVGMNVLSPKGNEWANWKNNILLGIDIITGIALLYFYIFKRLDSPETILFYIFLGILLISHSYRTIEFFSDQISKFCTNTHSLLLIL